MCPSCDLTHPNMYMGWLQLLGSLKVKVIFAKEPCKRNYILQKKPIILRSILIAATPYLLFITTQVKTHSYVWHDSFICVPWLIHMCAMTHSYVCHDSFMQVKSNLGGSFIFRCRSVWKHVYSHVTHMNESFHTYKWVISHIWMSHGTHMNESYHTHKWVMSHI